MRRVRIIERVPEPTFAERLEAVAARIASQGEVFPSNSPVMRGIASRIALTLEQIHSLRRVNNDMRDSILREDLFISTEIIQREPRPPVYADPRLPERDMLRGQLMRLERERRQLSLVEERDVRGLHDQLLGLLNEWRAVSGK